MTEGIGKRITEAADNLLDKIKEAQEAVALAKAELQDEATAKEVMADAEWMRKTFGRDGLD